MYQYDRSQDKDRENKQNRVCFVSLNKANKADIQEDLVVDPSIIYDPKESYEIRPTSNVSWNGNSLRVLYYVSKFVRQVKQASTKVKFRLITLKMLNLINDKASDQAVLEQSYNKHPFINFLTELVIEPDSKYKIIWDLTIFLSVFASLVYIPIYLGFDLKRDETFIFFETLPSLLLTLDIIVCCFTAFYNKGLIHRERILHNYAKTYLIQDLIIVLPGLLNLFSFQFTQLLLFLRIIKIPRMIWSLEELINLKENYANMFQLVKLGIFVILICHYCACLWAYIGIYQKEQNLYSWLIKYDIDDNVNSIYITSLYFSVITTLTIGYGDITPQTDIEKLYVVFIALLICAVLAYFISTIGNIFKSMSEKQDQFKSQMKIIVRYMRAKNLSPQIQIQVKKFYEHFFNQESELTNQAEQLLKNLNKDLKETIAKEIYSKLLKQSRLFSQMSDDLIKKICILVKEGSFLPGNIIFNKNDQISRLYYIIKGEVSYVVNEKTIQIQQHGPIAEKEFISQQRNNFSVKSSQFSQVAFIDYDELLRVIQDHKEDFENFSMLRDNLNFNEDLKNFGQICQVCKWTHSFMKCPYVFVTINKNRILRELKLSEKQLRNHTIRNQGKYPTFLSIKNTQDNVLAKILQHGIIRDEDLSDQYLFQLGFSAQITKLSKTLQVYDITNPNYSKSKEFLNDQSALIPRLQKNSQNSHSSITNKVNSYYDIKSREQPQKHMQQSKQTIPINIIQNFIHSRRRISYNSDVKIDNSNEINSQQTQNSHRQQIYSGKNNTSETDMLTQMEKQIEKSLFHNKTSINIDQLNIYQFYYPQYNVDCILNQLKQNQNIQQKFHFLEIFRRKFSRQV